MTPEQTSRHIRDHVTKYLAKHPRGSAAELCAYCGMHDMPSDVVNELNSMRTDGLIDGARLKGYGPSIQYWLRDGKSDHDRIAALERDLAEAHKRIAIINHEAEEHAKEVVSLRTLNKSMDAAIGKIHAALYGHVAPGHVVERVHALVGIVNDLRSPRKAA